MTPANDAAPRGDERSRYDRLLNDGMCSPALLTLALGEDESAWPATDKEAIRKIEQTKIDCERGLLKFPEQPTEPYSPPCNPQAISEDARRIIAGFGVPLMDAMIRIAELGDVTALETELDAAKYLEDVTRIARGMALAGKPEQTLEDAHQALSGKNIWAKTQNDVNEFFKAEMKARPGLSLAQVCSALGIATRSQLNMFHGTKEDAIARLDAAYKEMKVADTTPQKFQAWQKLYPEVIPNDFSEGERLRVKNLALDGRNPSEYFKNGTVEQAIVKLKAQIAIVIEDRETAAKAAKESTLGQLFDGENTAPLDFDELTAVTDKLAALPEAANENAPESPQKADESVLGVTTAEKTVDAPSAPVTATETVNVEIVDDVKSPVSKSAPENETISWSDGGDINGKEYLYTATWQTGSWVVNFSSCVQTLYEGEKAEAETATKAALQTIKAGAFSLISWEPTEPTVPAINEIRAELLKIVTNHDKTLAEDQRLSVIKRALGELPQGAKSALTTYGHKGAVAKLLAYLMADVQRQATEASASTNERLESAKENRALTIVDPSAYTPPVAVSTTFKMPSPVEFQYIKDMAQAVSRSGFYPSANTQEKALVIMMKGFTLGIDPMSSLDGIDVIEVGGKITMSFRAKLLKALVEKTGQCEKFSVIADNHKATAIVKRKGRSEQTYTFTMEDATQAKLLNNPTWQKYPKKMLTWRVVSSAIDVEFPEVRYVIGGSVDDEDDDILDAGDMQKASGF